MMERSCEVHAPLNDMKAPEDEGSSEAMMVFMKQRHVKMSSCEAMVVLMR